ncbi:proton-coupled amino acid transporter-like protein pathetic [Neodiprion fabricii]|uniref:proton-coupled amino acid transporter-like protein pathetic n=1 Tax=Neodiprion fabricii TaxID=2872261 RepID=UPI001ED96CF7|nr:proton-coupled amino acid transporter-like protein pathetic [Neodiprion fabricii]
MVSATEPPATELETFLPQDGSAIKDGALTGKYKVQVVPARDVEATGQTGDKGFDPFKERDNPNPTTNCDTLTHLLKACLGTGMLSMPFAFKSAGLVLGIFLTIFVGFICTYCAYVYIECAHKLYHRTRKSTMSFPEVAQCAFTNGPPWARPYAKTVRVIIDLSLFVSYFGTCTVYSVIIAQNINQVIAVHMGEGLAERGMIAILLVPFVLLSWVPNLKYLAPVSMVANAFMVVGLGITFYYFVMNMHPPSEVHMVTETVSTLPAFFSISIFAIEAIGVVMPLENNMKTPQQFIGICGVMNQGMSAVTLIYIVIGFMGYAAYRDETKENIITNLNPEDILAQVVKVLIALAVYCTFGLQFYVCLEIAWNNIKERFLKKPQIANYLLRTGLAMAAVLVAVAVPKIMPFVGLIGALCFSILGLIMPPIVELIVRWDEGFGRGYWLIVKTILVASFGLVVLLFGTYTAILDIFK